MRRLAETSLLLMGTLLLGVFVAALLHRHLGAAQARAVLAPAPALEAAEAIPTPERGVAIARAGAEAPRASDAAPLAAGPSGRALAIQDADTSTWSAGRIAAWLATLTGPGAEPVALLEIPAVGLSVPVLDDTDAWSLNRGVGHIAGTALPGVSGNLGIAGHRDGFFRLLRDVQPGDEVRLTLPDGASVRYRIEWTRVVLPEDVWVLDATPAASLTLVTCHPFYFLGSAPERFIVRAVRADGCGDACSGELASARPPASAAPTR